MTLTRGRRIAAAGQPLAPFDLDPFLSNSDRLPPPPSSQNSGGTNVAGGNVVNQDSLGSIFEGSLPTMTSSRPASVQPNEPRDTSAEPYWYGQRSRDLTYQSPTAQSEPNIAEPYFLNHSRPPTDGGVPSPPIPSGTASPNVPGQFPNWYHNIPANSPPAAPGPPLAYPYAPGHPQQAPMPQAQPIPAMPPIAPIQHQFPNTQPHLASGFVPHMGYPPYPYPMYQFPPSTVPAKLKPEEQQIDKLNEKDRLKSDGSNFFTWVTLLKSSLRTKGWLDFAEGRARRPVIAIDPSGYQTWQRIDDLTKHQIGMTMESSLYHQLGRNAVSACDLWSGVMKRFEANNFEARLDAELRLEMKRIRTGESMKQHITELRKLRDECIDRGAELSDRKWLSIIAKSLSDHPDWRREMSFPDDQMDPERFLMKLERLEAQGYVGRARAETAFNTRNRDNRRKVERTGQPLCNHCKRGHHSFEDCWAPGGGGEHKRPNRTKPAPNATQRERASLAARLEALEKRADALDKERAQLTAQLQQCMPATSPAASRPVSPVTVYEDEPLVARVATTEGYEVKFDAQRYAAMITRIPTHLNEKSLWILDSGATSHFTHDRSNFVSYKHIQPLQVGTADKGHSMQAVGVGVVVVTFSLQGKSTRVNLNDVLHVPALQSNLLSHPKLAQRGHCTYSNAERLYLMNGKTPFGQAKLVNNHWVLDMKVSKESANLVHSRKDVEQTVTVWHQRLAHMGIDRVKELAHNQEVEGISLVKSDSLSKCEACIFGKMPASPSPLRALRAKAPGDVIHADLEFMGHRSFSGAEISLKFLDEYSNYLWHYAISNKEANQILTLWKQLCAFFATQFQIRVKALHSDNGTEFVNSAMREFNELNGIEHHLIVPYRHEMNGRIERMNRTGSDAVRSMLTFANLSRAYWAEAYATFAYIHNRAAKSSVPGKTPHELLYKSKPTLSHVRIFGSWAYIRIPPEHRSKLDAKAARFRLMGYNKDAAYRLIDPNSHKIEFSRDVVFDEFNSVTPCQLYLPPSPRVHVSNPSLPLSPPIALPRRSERIAAQRRNREAANLTSEPVVPNNVNQAFASIDGDEWRRAMEYEKDKLEEMGVWTVVERPKGTHTIRGRWVFATKPKVDGSYDFRARWVARGDSQIPGLEFGETYAVAGDFRTARIVIAISARETSSLLAVNITSAYLHSPLQEDNIFVEYPTGFSVNGLKDPVCHLKKALYIRKSILLP